jgi:methyl-accepting chemotaxis protein
MNSWTLSKKIGGSFALVAALAVALALVSVYALREAVASKDHVVAVSAQRLLDAERLHALSITKAAESRSYLLTGEPTRIAAVREAHETFRRTVETLRHQVETAEGIRSLDEVVRAEDLHERALEPMLGPRNGKAPAEDIAQRYEHDVRPARVALDAAVSEFVRREEALLREQRDESTRAAESATRVVVTLAVLVAALAVVLSFTLSRTLSRQIGSAVRHVQSSTAELQAVAGQQATGAKEQASAMAEITTTLNELLATSRQIAESAQRVAGIAADTASAAKSGDQTILRSQESVGSIRRQVELIVEHMLDLGKKSQQIGGILEIINELAEQTNILAVNATIEAAGAGDAGKRFAVVAEEIRKLSDRVGGSTKEIRVLIDEVRSAVNTTVMATESGSKAVETGARQFGDVAAAFAQIAALVATTTEAAREIELSTRQQASAVEQVNAAVTNVAQATRESEASTGQALQTASQLADMSRDLATLVEPRAAA